MAVTIKSAVGSARSFASNWSMVMGYKNGTLIEAQYTDQYMKILDAVSVETWRWLYAPAAEGGEVVLLCYCCDGCFRHTNLIIRYATEKYPRAFSKK